MAEQKAACKISLCNEMASGCDYCEKHHMTMCGQLHHRLPQAEWDVHVDSPSWGEWQPIELAPKDGTKILAYPVFGEVGVVAWWRSNIHRDGGAFINGNMAVVLSVWMPLPPPPAQKGDG